MTLYERVRQVLVEALDIGYEQVTPEASLVGDLRADSLEIVDITMRLGDEFQIEFPDEDMDTITTVGDIVRYIEARGN